MAARVSASLVASFYAAVVQNPTFIVPIEASHGDRRVGVVLVRGFSRAPPTPALGASFAEMATVNPFDLLVDDDSEDPSQLIAAHQQKIASKKPAATAAPQAPAKLPTKPLPPAQAGQFRCAGSIPR